MAWPLYLTQMAATSMGDLTDGQKLSLLSGVLDQSSRAELQRRQEKGETIRYQEFWNWMVNKYGGDTQAAIRGTYPLSGHIMMVVSPCRGGTILRAISGFCIAG